LQCRGGKRAHSEGGRDHPVVRRPARHEGRHVGKYEVPSHDEVGALSRGVAKLDAELDELRERVDEMIGYLKGGVGDAEGRPAGHEECHVVKYEVPSHDEIRDLRRSVAKLEDDLDDLREQLDEVIRYLKGGAGDEEGLPVGR